MSHIWTKPLFLVLSLTIFNKVAYLTFESRTNQYYGIVWLWNHAQIHSRNQPVLCNEGKVTCSRKQREPLMVFKLKTDQLQVRCAYPLGHAALLKTDLLVSFMNIGTAWWKGHHLPYKPQWKTRHLYIYRLCYLSLPLLQMWVQVEPLGINSSTMEVWPLYLARQSGVGCRSPCPSLLQCWCHHYMDEA